jgi:hypothetical protein
MNASCQSYSFSNIVLEKSGSKNYFMKGIKMKKLVLLATVLALCVPAFGGGDPNNQSVLVYNVKADISSVNYTNDSYTDAEFGTGKVEGYVLGRFVRATLATFDGDPNNDAPIFILLDKKAKEYVVISEENDADGEHVEFAFDDNSDNPIFSKNNKNGKDSGQDYIWAYLYVDVDDIGTGDTFFNLDAWNGLTQITSSVIKATATKMSVPKNIKFNVAEAYSETDLTIAYKTAVSVVLNSNYTKLANNDNLQVKSAAALITADLDAKGWSKVSAADYFGL